MEERQKAGRYGWRRMRGTRKTRLKGTKRAEAQWVL